MCLFTVLCSREVEYRQISYEDYLDKVDGAWLGQMIGVTFGEPTEFRYQGKIVPFNLDYYYKHTGKGNKRQNYKRYTPDGAPDQDDVYIELLFLHCIKNYGINVTARQIAEEWLKRMDYNRVWHANKAAHTNFMKGIWPPESGNPKYNRHADDIDFQIESDLFGIISPGLPQESNRWCDKVGHIMNYGDGVYGGMFVAGMYTIAFFETDVQKIVSWGLRCIPKESRYAKVIRDVMDWHKQYSDWTYTWNELQKKWGNTDSCPDGKGKPFNIDAKMNGAYIVMGLLYGEGDFEKTINIAMRCGQDSDCNPSNAAGILGCSLGASGIPKKWKAPMKDFIYNISMKEIYPGRIPRIEIVKTTAEIGKQLIMKNGGKIIKKNGREILNIPVQEPVPPKKLEISKW